MPEYKYICPTCGNNFIVEKKISEYQPNEDCPKCGEKSNRDIKNYCNEYSCKTTGFYGKTSI